MLFGYRINLFIDKVSRLFQLLYDVILFCFAEAYVWQVNAKTCYNFSFFQDRSGQTYYMVFIP